MTRLRTFLFLQGPHGPFFAELAAGLRQRNHRTVKINLNGGDRHFWSGDHGLSFQEPYAHWGDYVRGVMQRYGVTDLVVYGDCRPHHKLALRLARAQGVRVHVFEEGYLRPNWVTLESNGVNGFSRLSRNPDEIRHLVKELEEPPAAPNAGRVTRMMGLMCLAYAAASALGRRQFRHYRSHRVIHPLEELRDWVLRLMGYPLRRLSVAWWSGRVLRDPRHRYVVLMQLNGDYQLRTHSYYDELEVFLVEVMRSFVANAPKDSILVYKNHPLDTGRIAYRRLVRAHAQRLGIAERVHFIDGGKLVALLRGARGALTINSTSGMVALANRVPLIALGDAIYNIRGLTYAGALASFWTEAKAPDGELFAAFRRYLKANALLRGSYYTRRGRRMAVNDAVERLCDRLVAQTTDDSAQDRLAPARGSMLARSEDGYWRTLG